MTPCQSHYPAWDQEAAIHLPPTTWLPGPGSVVQHAAAMCAEGEIDGLSSLFGSMGTPPLDLLVTPLSARAGLMAAAQGQVFFHHELRGRLPVPEALAPERQVWEKGAVPVWVNGVLTQPKYFSFFLDGQIAPYHPNYRRKWRAHELLHGTVGFYWHPEMTRFSCYLGARLDELLPVVHWHWLDEAFRPRCEAHRSTPMFRDFCPTCEGAAVPYWSHPEEWVAAEAERATEWVTQGWSHLDAEWQACWQECETGRRFETHHSHLNASSDAMGYLYSHWPRLTAWSFGAWVEMFLVDGRDYHSNIPAMMQRVMQATQSLVSGELFSSVEAVTTLRARRALLDLGYRALQLLEWFEESSPGAQVAEDALMPCVEAAATLAHKLLEGDDNQAQAALGEVPACIAQILRVSEEVGATGKGMPPGLTEGLAMLGYGWEGAAALLSTTRAAQHTVSTPLIERGLLTAAPQAFERAEIEVRSLPLDEFVAAPEFAGPGRLLSRFSTWCAAQPNQPKALQEWVAFEAWLYEPPGQDEEADCFATLPESVADLVGATGTLRLHTTFRMREWPASLLADALGELPEGGAGLIAAIQRDSAPQLMLIEPAMLPVLEALQSNEPLTDWFAPDMGEILLALLDHGFVVWLPAPMGSRPTEDS